MSQAQWSAVDQYLTDALIPHDQALEQALADSTAAGLPQINVSAAQGKFLHLLALAQGARNILEIGTLGGYSTIWLARALPADGRLITLEFSPKHAEVATRNIARAGLAERVEVRVGRALDSLPKLHAEGKGPFDLVFIDADKTNIPDYFTWAMQLTRKGSVILVDNVIRGGTIADAASTHPDTVAVRKLNTMMGADPRVSATVLQTVGVKGYDGLSMAVVVSN
jgi:predicted O-methyltransferase YrrM